MEVKSAPFLLAACVHSDAEVRPLAESSLAALATSLPAEQLKDAIAAFAAPVAQVLDPAALGYASALKQKSRALDVLAGAVLSKTASADSLSRKRVWNARSDRSRRVANEILHWSDFVL